MVMMSEHLDQTLPSGMQVFILPTGEQCVQLQKPITVEQETELIEHGLFITRRFIEVMHDGVETEYYGYMLSKGTKTET